MFTTKEDAHCFTKNIGCNNLWLSFITDSNSDYIVDSMPLEICKLSRSKRSKICKEHEHIFPDKGCKGCGYSTDYSLLVSAIKMNLGIYTGNH